jgi:nucleotide-binding universal stress UspA family protein
MNSAVPSSQVGPVVVGVDGSRTTSGTLDLAAAEAVRHRATLQIVHVWPGRYTGVFRSRGVVPSRADGRRLLEVAERRARMAEPDLPIGTELLEGGAAHVLTECSTWARLLVVGHRDDLPMRPSWGSTAAYLAHHSGCPLLVHRGAVTKEGPVVVAASARPSGAATLGYAFAEAALLGTRLVAVHMWTRPGAAEGTAPVIAVGGYATEREAAEHALAEALAAWSGRFPEVRVDRLVVHDLDMAYTIARASRRGRLLVAGIGRHGRFAELLYGSLSAGPAGLRQATGPVVLVPAGWSAGEQLAARGGPARVEPR